MARHEAGHCGALALVESIVETDPERGRDAKVWLDDATVSRLRGLIAGYTREVKTEDVSLERAFEQRDRARAVVEVAPCLHRLGYKLAFPRGQPSGKRRCEDSLAALSRAAQAPEKPSPDCERTLSLVRCRLN